jgi:hypothetical protein
VVRLLDRLLARGSFDNYNEYAYSGAYAVTTSDPSGRSKEGAAAGVVRSAREAFGANGVVFGCAVARQALFSEARFVFQSAVDKHLFGNMGLALLEYPWPNATQGELLARMEQDGGTAAGNAYIRRAVPEDGTDARLVQMRPDCVVIVSEEKRDNLGRTYRQPIGYAEDLTPMGSRAGRRSSTTWTRCATTARFPTRWRRSKA